MTTLLIDNYDSFTWNVYQYLCQLGAKVQVFRNDEITLQECIALNPRNVVISPGPGHPSAAGVSNDVIRHFAGKVPILGVCLGEQAMYEVYGGTVTYAGELIHGKTSPVRHDGRGLYKGLEQGFEVTRYHSLAGDPKTLPDVLEITSTTDSGLIMGIRHKSFVMEGVQYHPESVSSENGHKMFATFLKWEGGTWDTLVIREDLVMNVEPAKSKVKTVGSGMDVSEITKLNSTSRNGHAEVSEKKDSILETIKRQRLIDVHDAKLVPGQSSRHLEQIIAMDLAPPLIDFYERLSSDNHNVGVLAEIKRASPSKGNIDLSVDVPSQALSYAQAGAVAISVLTEPKWFKGRLTDMQLVRKAIEGFPLRPAVLRKDFIIDEYQILEARCYGADTILLIVAILSDSELASLMSYSRLLGMEPLVEVANDEEMRRAISAGAKVIGVNNRDLHTFTVDMDRTSTLSRLVPPEVFLIALSGISTRADVEKYMASGARGVLVGEALMKSPNAQTLIKSLMGVKTDIPQVPSTPRTKVKICGITNADDAVASAKAGANFLGLIFVPSPRQISVEQAKAISISLGRARHGPHGKPTFSHTDTASWFKSCHDWIEEELKTTEGQLLVGVFSNAGYSHINSVVKEVGLDLVQMHGDEPPALARLISVPVIKAIHIMEDDSVATVGSRIQKYVGSAHVILLDTGVKGKTQQGGAGITFNWDLAAELQKQFPILIAGGLNPTNVAEAVNKIHPWGVDVSSGLEKDKGIKDNSKILKFMASVSQLK
jgi:anthranilate synthase/indole-3-glycerol phosphate synthase/phosphoribosylanthranilate isomerase